MAGRAAPDETAAPAPLSPGRPLWSLRDLSRSVLARFVAHLLIRLLVVSSLPAQWQAGAALLPVSLLWGVLREAERPAADPPQTPQAQGPTASSERSPDPASVQVTRVKETFTLASGEVASGEERAQDILLFRKPAAEGVALSATIPITPSRTFSGTELVQGKVHLDILAGRESVRGKTGGSDAVTLESGDARLSVASGALGENTAIAFEQAGTLSSFLPSSGDLLPLAEMVVDFSGKTLSRGAELSVLATGVSADDTLLVAEVVRVGDVPRVAVVALAQLVSDRVVSVAYPGLPGIVEGGRYVFYRTSPVGFVSGATSSPAGPVKAVVGTDSLAFVSYSRLDGSYIVAARPGGVGLTARVTGTSLVGAGMATVVATQTSSLNISLAGAVTAAIVTPADGSVDVPTSVQVEITTSSPMNPSTVSADSVKLFKGPVSEGQAVAVRFVLSASVKTLAVIPQAALESGTSYTLVASGLADAFGGLLHVPTTTFKTKESTLPVYDLRKLTFSFPDQDGLVTVSAPAGTFPPGTTILIINSGNGVVLSLTAENDGAVGKLVPATLPATIDDQMLVTITDPLGNETTFTRSVYVDAATGKTAVGAGGGVVGAADASGVELRIPEGAVGKAVTLRIESVSAAQLEALFPAQKPDLPGASVAGALKIESADRPEFKKEVKLAFPLPPGLPANPQDAFFYVYRRLEGPKGADGKPTAAFEVLDQAFIEGTGDAARVVTASPPFAGYENSLGAFGFSPAGNFLLQTALNAYAFLVWTYDATLPGKPLPGVITGKVLRARWVENTATGTTASAPVYEPVNGATVSVLDQGGVPAIVGGTPNPTLAITGADGADGTFTLWDTAYTGGSVQITATLPEGVPSQGCPATETDSDTVRCATAYEANPLDWKSTGLRFYRNIATGTVTFPAAPPSSPPPVMQIKPMAKDSDGSWKDAGSLVVAETPLLIGFATTPKLRVTGASIQGASYSVRSATEADPAGLTYVLVNPDSADRTYAPPTPGNYTIVATGLPEVGALVTQSATFRVIAAGGGVDTLQGVPPEVLVPTVPENGAKEVPVAVFPQVNFTEPVTRVAVAIHLLEGQTEVAVALSGFGPDGVVPKVASDSRVTSVTLQPLLGLKYDATYTIRVDNTIQDLDTDAQGQSTPRKLVSRDSQGNGVDQPYQSSFKTFGPEGLPGSGDTTFGSPGIVVLGERAYLVQNNFTSGTLHAFDITDPTSVKDVTKTPATALGRPVDIAGDFHDGGLGKDVAPGAPLVAVATASANKARPSNLHLYDASGDNFTWLGAASLASSAVEGYINRVVVKGALAYAVTVGKGVQVVDLRALKQNFLNTGGTSSTAYWKMLRSLNTDGEGFGQSAVTTIPVKNTAGGDYRLNDLKVGEWVVGGVSQRLVVAAGQPSLTTPQGSLVVVNPQTSVVLSRFPIASADGTAKLTYANAVALGTMGTSPGAVVVGSGTSPAGAGPMLAAVNLASPAKPALLSLVSLQEASCLGQGIVDVLLKDTAALVGGAQCVVLVNLTDPTKPILAGTIDGVGGRLALGEGNILFSTARSILGGTDPLGGVRSAALGRIAIIEKIKPTRVVVDQTQRAAEAFEVKYKVIPADSEAQSAQIELRSGGVTFLTQAASLTSGAGATIFPIGTDLSKPASEVRLVVNPGTSEQLVGFPKRLGVGRVSLEPSEAIEVSADDRELPLLAYSDSHLGRALEAADLGLPEQTVSLAWEVLGSTATVSPNPSVTSSGVFKAILRTPTVAGSTFRVQARLPGSGVLGVSQAITVVPGSAKDVTLTADRGALPADAASETTLTLTARDEFGNPVQDGTVVSWVVDGRGVVEPAVSTTAGGTTTVKYRAGDVEDSALIVARIDEAEASTTVILAPIQVTVTPGSPSVVANSAAGIPVAISATSSAGAPSDAAALVLSATLGRLIGPSSLTGGQATAAFVPSGIPRQARLWASVTTHRGEGFVEVVRPSGFFVSLDRPGFVGNRTEDGVATVESIDGTVRNVPYSTSTLLNITADPGDTVVLKLGDTAIPNVEPIALYPMDDLEQGAVVDEYHDHPARVSGGGVSVDLLRKTTGAGSLRFTGDGRVEVPDHAALRLTDRLGFAADFRVETAQGATLVSKAGAYGLALVPEDGGVRVKAFVAVEAVGEVSTLSRVVSLGTWHSASAMLENGLLILDVNGEETRVAVSGAVETREGVVTLGEGLLGNLDNVRLFDLSRPKLVAFEDGTYQTEVPVGPSGQAMVRIRSLGNLRSGSPNEIRQNVKWWIKDRLITPQTSFYDIWSLELKLGFLDGLITGEIDSPEHLAGDVVASLLIYGDARDGVITGNKVGEGTATTGDYFVLAFSLLGLFTQIGIVGEAVTVPLKDGAKVLRRIADPSMRRLFSLVYLEAIRDFIRGVRRPLLELATFCKAILNPTVLADFYRISGGFRNKARLWAIVRLTARTGESGRIIKGLGAAHAALGSLDEATKLKYIGDLVDIMAHHLDEAGKLGIEVAVLSDEAILGAARFLEVTKDAGKAKEMVGTFVNAQKNLPKKWHPEALDEYLKYVSCFPANTKGLSSLLTKPARDFKKIQGAYAVLRLYCEAPELKGKPLDTVADLVEGGKEGVDLISRLAGNVPEFWEIKYVETAGQVADLNQISKHLRTRLAAHAALLRSQGLSGPALKEAMSQVKLKINAVVKNSSNLPGDKEKIFQDVMDAIRLDLEGGVPEVKALLDAGFTFSRSDIFLRKADPLVEKLLSLPASL